MIIFQILKNTPIWVWIIFAVLIQRGSKLFIDNPVSIQKSLILPLVFIIWGIDRMSTKFYYRELTFLIYLLFLFVGTGFAYYLYRHKKYYVKDGIIFQQGSWVPLAIMMINFIVKYMLNICMSAQPEVYQQLAFNLIYGVISGFTVGLFFGGVAKTVLSTKQLKEE